MPAYREIRPDAVAIYIRWSTDEQTEGTTLETQKERCSLYLKSQGWNVNDDLIFIDDGYSGGSLDRPALTKLRQRVKAGQVDCVVSYSLDRLSRSVADTVTLVQHEWLTRCVYRSASQPIATDDGNPTGQLIFNILASFAEFERALIRERTHSGHIRRAKEGKYPGAKHPPYGYRRDGKGALVIDAVAADGTLQGPAAVVRRMFDLAATGPVGQGPSLIARALTDEGAPAPTGGRWWVHVVARILQNPVYCGNLVYGRLPVNPARRRDKAAPHRLRGQKPLVEVAGAVPPIVDAETWHRVQQLFRDRTHQGRQARNRSLLSSLARCRCGGALSVFYDRAKTRYYRCTRNFQAAGGCAYAPGVLNADEMDQAVVQAIKARYGSPDLRQEAAAIARAAQAGGEANGRRAIAEIDRRIQQIDADLARVRRAARRGEIQLATFEELRLDAEAERQALQAQRSEREQNQKDNVAPINDVWDDLEITAQRDIIYGLFRNITIYRRRGTPAAPEIDLVWETQEGAEEPARM